MVEDHHLNAKINMKIIRAVKDSGLLAVLEKPFSIEQAEIVLKQCLAETSPKAILVSDVSDDSEAKVI